MLCRSVIRAPGAAGGGCGPVTGSVAQSCPALCDPMDCSTPGLPVHRQLPEFTQTQVHRVGDAIQPSHPLSSPSPPAFTLSQPSVQFSRSVLSDSLRPHELQHARPPCPSPTPGVHSNSRPSSHQSFPMSQFFASGDQSIRVSASVSVVPVNIQD